jgi:ferredoxin
MPSRSTYCITFILPNETQTCLEVADDERILIAAYRAGLDLPSLCLQGWCNTCAARVEGKGAWDQSASLRYYPVDRSAGFILLCTATPRSDLCLRTHQRAALRHHRLSHKLPTPRA